MAFGVLPTCNLTGALREPQEPSKNWDADVIENFVGCLGGLILGLDLIYSFISAAAIFAGFALGYAAAPLKFKLI